MPHINEKTAPTSGTASSTTPSTNPDDTSRLVVELVAAVLVSDPGPVLTVLDDTLDLRDVALIDRPAAVVLHAARDLAAAGIRPTADAVNRRLSVTGQHAGHRGKLAADRVLDAIGHPLPTGPNQTAVLAELARPLISELLLERLAASAEATMYYALHGNLYDALAGRKRDDVEVRRLVDVYRALQTLEAAR